MSIIVVFIKIFRHKYTSSLNSFTLNHVMPVANLLLTKCLDPMIFSSWIIFILLLLLHYLIGLLTVIYVPFVQSTILTVSAIYKQCTTVIQTFNSAHLCLTHIEFLTYIFLWPFLFYQFLKDITNSLCTQMASTWSYWQWFKINFIFLNVLLFQ